MLSEAIKSWVQEQIRERTNALVEQFTQAIRERDARIQALTAEVQALRGQVQLLEAELRAQQAASRNAVPTIVPGTVANAAGVPGGIEVPANVPTPVPTAAEVPLGVPSSTRGPSHSPTSTHVPRGVYRRGNKWRAKFRQRFLGTYDTQSEALTAYAQAKQDYHRARVSPPVCAGPPAHPPLSADMPAASVTTPSTTTSAPAARRAATPGANPEALYDLLNPPGEPEQVFAEGYTPLPEVVGNPFAANLARLVNGLRRDRTAVAGEQD